MSQVRVGRMDIDCLPSRATPGKQDKHWNSVHYASMRSCHTQQWYSTVQYGMGPFWKQLIMPTYETKRMLDTTVQFNPVWRRPKEVKMA